MEEHQQPNGHPGPEAKPKSAFPKVWMRCPNCRCPETVAEKMYAELKAAGKLTEPAPDGAASSKLLQPLDRPKLIGSTSYAVYHELAVCSNCGTMYARRVDIAVGSVGPAPGARPTQ